MTRVALYTRVSTEDQAKEGFSLAAQMTRLRAYAIAQSWVVTGEYVDDGKSGRNTNRPAYQQMMKDRAQWDTLLVLKMDRIHRNSRNFMEMMDGLRKDGKQFASVTESLDTATAMGRFVMDIIQRIAQLESEVNGERTFAGMEQKAKEGGGSLGKPAPFGYRWENSKLVHESKEVPVVQAILYQFHNLGLGPTAIAMNLNATPGCTTRGGAAWSYWNVRQILDSVTYQGHTKWKGTLQRNTHEPIRVPEGIPIGRSV